MQQYNKVVQQNKNLQAELNNYKKALEKIKNELETNATCNAEGCDKDDADRCLECTIDLILEITNKALNIHEK